MIDDFLESDHESLGELLQTVEESLANRNLRRAHEVLDLFWARLATHIRAENLCLFPAILNAPSELFAQKGVPSIEDVRAAIASLRNDHNFFMDELIVGIKSLRTHLADPEPSDAAAVAEKLLPRIAQVKERLDSHNQLEEQQVYRWPAALLSNLEITQLESEIRHQVQNLPPRFADRGEDKRS